MASRIPSFFLAPSWDYLPPPMGPIKLGNIITSVDTPQEPLYTHTTLAVTTEQRNFSLSTKQLKERRLGMFSKFLSMITGFGADASVSFEKSHDALFTFDSLQTVQFIPTLEYLEKCIAIEPVKRYLMKSRYREPVYIITGLKIARGAKIRSIRTRTIDRSFGVEVDATAWGGVPVGIGPEFGTKTGNQQEVEWEGANDFVFAYRLRKVAVTKPDKVKANDDYVKGAMMEDSVDRPEERAAEFVSEEEEFIDTDLSEDGGFMDFMFQEGAIWIMPRSNEGE